MRFQLIDCSLFNVSQLRTLIIHSSRFSKTIKTQLQNDFIIIFSYAIKIPSLKLAQIFSERIHLRKSHVPINANTILPTPSSYYSRSPSSPENQKIGLDKIYFPTISFSSHTHTHIQFAYAIYV